MDVWLIRGVRSSIGRLYSCIALQSLQEQRLSPYAALCPGHNSQKGPSRAVPGLFLAVPHGTRSSISFTPRGPRVTFNSNLNVTRAPAINKPRIKPVNCPAGARRGPCRDPPGTRGQIVKESKQGTRPNLLRYPGRRLWGPDSACRGHGRSPTDARMGPGRDP